MFKCPTFLKASQSCKWIILFTRPTRSIERFFFLFFLECSGFRWCGLRCISLENIWALNRRSLNAVVWKNKNNIKNTHTLSLKWRHKSIRGDGMHLEGPLLKNKSSWASCCSIIVFPLAGSINKRPSPLSVYLTRSINLPSSLLFHEMFTISVPPPSLQLHISLSFPFILWSP